MKKSIRFVLAVLIIVIMASFLIVGCQKEAIETTVTETTTAATTAAEETTAAVKLKIGYVNKFLNIDWFQNEEKGIKDICALNDIEYVGAVDANNDLEKFLAGVDQMIAKGANALALVVPNPSIGPAVADKCNAAGVAMAGVQQQVVVLTDVREMERKRLGVFFWGGSYFGIVWGSWQMLVSSIFQV